MRRLVLLLAAAALAAAVGGTSALGLTRGSSSAPPNECLGAVNRETLAFLASGLPAVQVCLLDSCPDPRPGLGGFRQKLVSGVTRSCQPNALGGLPSSACRAAAGGDPAKFAACVAQSQENAVVGLGLTELGCRGATCNVPPTPSPTRTPTVDDPPTPTDSVPPTPTPTAPPCQARLDGPCSFRGFEGCCDAAAVCHFNIIGRPRRNGYCAMIPGIVRPTPTCAPGSGGPYGSTCKAFVGGTTASLLD